MFYGIKAVLAEVGLAVTAMLLGPSRIRAYSRSRYTPHQGRAECRRRRGRVHAYQS
ncbi:MAG: hypothetical protein ACYCV6_03720 [Steroidobacteraceae bacterium]